MNVLATPDPYVQRHNVTIFSEDVLIPEQWDVRHASDVRSPEAMLCQAVVLDAVREAQKYVAVDSVKARVLLELAIDWIEGRIDAPLSFHKALAGGFPSLDSDVIGPKLVKAIRARQAKSIAVIRKVFVARSHRRRHEDDDA